MKTIINNSNCSIAEVQHVPIEFATLIIKPDPCTEYSVEIDNKAESTPMIKVEKYEPSEPRIANETIKTTKMCTCRNEACENCLSAKNQCERTKMQQTNFKCDLCTKRFTTRQILRRHTKIHTNNKSYKCEICSKHFAANRNLLQHLKIHSSERNHKCEICAKRFTTKEILQRHTKTHTDGKNYRCEVCTKCFTTKQILSRHTTIHTGERNYECEICTKCFTTKDNLSKHVKAHTDERNYKCEICAKRFKIKNVLWQHIKTHTDERNYKCEVCGKCFTTKKILSGHRKTHTDERNYKCEICTKCFTRKEYLFKHTKKHTDSSYKCGMCERYFGKRKAFLEHKKTHVGGSGEEDFLRQLSCNGENIVRLKNRLVREEFTSFTKNEDMDINSDTTKQKPITTNESYVDTAVKIEKYNPAENFNLWQSLNNEIMIKEEENMMASSSFIDNPDFVDVKQEIFNT